jgi:hypothetical protein
MVVRASCAATTLRFRRGWSTRSANWDAAWRRCSQHSPTGRSTWARSSRPAGLRRQGVAPEPPSLIRRSTGADWRAIPPTDRGGGGQGHRRCGRCFRRHFTGRAVGPFNPAVLPALCKDAPTLSLTLARVCARSIDRLSRLPTLRALRRFSIGCVLRGQYLGEVVERFRCGLRVSDSAARFTTLVPVRVD